MKETVKYIFLWFVSHAVYFFIGLFVISGLGFAFANSPDMSKLSPVRQTISFLACTLFMGGLCGYLIDAWQWNPYLVCMTGLLLSLVVYTFLLLVLKAGREQDTIEGFLSRFGKAVSAFRGGPSGGNNTPTNTP